MLAYSIPFRYDSYLSAVPSSQDTVTGFVLAGVGHRNAEGSNFLVVKAGLQINCVQMVPLLLASKPILKYRYGYSGG